MLEMYNPFEVIAGVYSHRGMWYVYHATENMSILIQFKYSCQPSKSDALSRFGVVAPVHHKVTWSC